MSAALSWRVRGKGTQPMKLYRIREAREVVEKEKQYTSTQGRYWAHTRPALSVANVRVSNMALLGTRFPLDASFATQKSKHSIEKTFTDMWDDTQVLASDHQAPAASRTYRTSNGRQYQSSSTWP